VAEKVEELAQLEENLQQVQADARWEDHCGQELHSGQQMTRTHNSRHPSAYGPPPPYNHVTTMDPCPSSQEVKTAWTKYAGCKEELLTIQHKQSERARKIKGNADRLCLFTTMSLQAAFLGVVCAGCNIV
jgi:hypothetical protein